MSLREHLLLPSATRLVHIGPHKTGTTSLQGAFHIARERLPEHGVHYAGSDTQPARAALTVAGQPTLIGEREPQLSDWEELVAEVAAAGRQRVVVSSEFFADADDAAARRVVDELGGSSVHVLVTLRPLTKILPSQWQQIVQNGLRTPYEKWLDGILNKPTGSPSARRFWRRHNHGQLVRRWADAVGPGRLTVIVVDEQDPRMLPRTVEALTGLPSGFLVPDDSQVNRSLTLAETEIIRRFNEAFRAEHWPDRVYAKYLRRGAVTRMKTARRPTPDEPRIVSPPWALKRAAELGAESADAITESGVRVIGDISTLGVPNGAEAADMTPTPAMEAAAAAAAQAVAGAIAVSGEADPDQPVEDMRVKYVETRTLLRVILQRVTRRVTDVFRGSHEHAPQP